MPDDNHTTQPNTTDPLATSNPVPGVPDPAAPTNPSEQVATEVPETPTATPTEPLPSFINMDSSIPTPPPATSEETPSYVKPVVEEQPSMPEETPPIIQDGSSAPSFDIPSVITPSGKPKAKVGGKVIATILGILLLVGGVGVGLYELGQQQDIRKRASGYGDFCDGTNSCHYYDCSQQISCSGAGQGSLVSGFCDTGYPAGDPCGRNGNDDECIGNGYTCSSGSDCCSGYCDGSRCGTKPSDDTPPPDDACSGTKSVSTSISCIPDHELTNECNGSGQRCTTIYVGEYGWAESCCSGRSSQNNEPLCGGTGTKYYCIPGGYCIENTTCDYRDSVGCAADETCEGTQTNPPSDSPSPTPSPTPICLNIKAYNTDWVELTADELKKLKSGTTIYLTVKGSGGTFDKARFKINNASEWSISETKKPETVDEFYYSYPIPENITTFAVEAQVHITAGDWK